MITKSVFKFILIFGILVNIFFLFSNSANAQVPTNSQSATDPTTVQNIANQIANSSCPDPIKNILIDNSGAVPRPRTGVTFYLNGTFIVAKDGNNQAVSLTCANANSLQKLIIRGVMILYTLIGLALAFGVGKSAIGMMTALGDAEKFQTNAKGLGVSIGATVGVLFSYTILIFVVVGVMGFGRVNPDKPEYNLFCNNTIVFNLAFDGATPC